MGQSISAVIASVDQQEERRKEANDALNALFTIATQRADIFYERVRNAGYDPSTVPISRVIYRYQYIHCGVSKNPAGIKDAISGALENFCSGEILNGVTKIIGSSLDVLMGNYSANQSSTTTSVLSTGTLGGLARIDTDLYSYRFTSSSLSSITEDVLVASIVISSCDIKNLTRNDIASIIQVIYNSVGAEEMRKIQAILLDAIFPPQVGIRSFGAEEHQPNPLANLGLVTNDNWSITRINGQKVPIIPIVRYSDLDEIRDMYNNIDGHDKVVEEQLEKDFLEVKKHDSDLNGHTNGTYERHHHHPKREEFEILPMVEYQWETGDVRKSWEELGLKAKALVTSRIVNHILECPKKAGPFKDKAKTQDGLHVFFKYHVLRFPEEKQSADVKLLMVESYMEESQVQNDQPFSITRVEDLGILMAAPLKPAFIALPQQVKEDMRQAIYDWGMKPANQRIGLDDNLPLRRNVAVRWRDDNGLPWEVVFDMVNRESPDEWTLKLTRIPEPVTSTEPTPS